MTRWIPRIQKTTLVMSTRKLPRLPVQSKRTATALCRAEDQLAAALASMQCNGETLQGYVASKAGRATFPEIWQQLQDNIDHERLKRNTRELLAGIGASPRRCATSLLAKGLSAQFAQDELGVTPRYLRHARQQSYNPLTERLMTEKYQPGVKKVKVHVEERWDHSCMGQGRRLGWEIRTTGRGILLLRWMWWPLSQVSNALCTGFSLYDSRCARGSALVCRARNTTV